MNTHIFVKNLKLFDGYIVYNGFNIDKTLPFHEQWYAYAEDILQVVYDDRWVLDVGWYPEGNPRGSFMVHIVIDHDWHEPFLKIRAYTLVELKEVIEYAAAIIKNIRYISDQSLNREMLLLQAMKKNDKRRLYFLVDCYLMKKLDGWEFSNEFFGNYNLLIDHDALHDYEENIFKDLAITAAHFSSFEEDHKTYPGMYYTPQELDQKILQTKEALKDYWIVTEQ